MNKDEIIPPIAHLNGNSKESLTDGWDTIAESLGKLRESINANHEIFHDRNYYPLGVAKLDESNAQRREFFDHLAQMEIYAETIRENLYNLDS